MSESGFETTQLVAGEKFRIRRVGDRWQAQSMAFGGGRWGEAHSVAFALIKARQYTDSPEAFGVEARKAELRVRKAVVTDA